MKHTIQSLLLAGAAAVLLFGSVNTHAQRGGDFDPAAARQRQMDSYRERLAITSDDEWKVILPRIEKVVDARTALQPFNTTGGRGFGGGGRGGRGGRGGEAGDATAGGRGRGFGGTVNPTVTALAEAVEAGAPVEDLKAKAAAFREEKKVKEADLVKAQDELKKLLSAKQEVIALTMGLVH